MNLSKVKAKEQRRRKEKIKKKKRMESVVHLSRKHHIKQVFIRRDRRGRRNTYILL